MLISSETTTMLEIPLWDSCSRGLAILLPLLSHLHSRDNTASPSSPTSSRGTVMGEGDAGQGANHTDTWANQKDVLPISKDRCPCFL